MFVMTVCACACLRVYVCVCACVRACVCVCVCVRARARPRVPPRTQAYVLIKTKSLSFRLAQLCMPQCNRSMKGSPGLSQVRLLTRSNQGRIDALLSLDPDSVNVQLARQKHNVQRLRVRVDASLVGAICSESVTDQECADDNCPPD